MLSKNLLKSSLVFSFLFTLIFSSTFSPAKAANPDQVKTVTVTVNTKNKMVLPELGKEDFLVSESGEQKKILSVSHATNKTTPINLTIVIQESSGQINNEISTLKQFITSLPVGSQVAVTYLNGNFVQNVQPFTNDLNKAAKKLRIVSSFSGLPSSPYVSLIDVMKQFNGMKQGRNQVLLISNGLDALSGGFSTPTSNIYLERAVKIAQQENISIYSIFSGSPLRRASFSGQNNLGYLSEETGGYAFAQGTGFVSFDAPLKEFRQMLNNQYVITYKSDSHTKGFRRVKVTTDFSNLKVIAPKGYVAKS